MVKTIMNSIGLKNKAFSFSLFFDFWGVGFGIFFFLVVGVFLCGLFFVGVFFLLVWGVFFILVLLC